MDEMDLLKEEGSAEKEQVREIEEWSDQGSDDVEEHPPVKGT